MNLFVWVLSLSASASSCIIIHFILCKFSINYNLRLASSIYIHYMQFMNSDMTQTTYISGVLLKVHLWAARKEKKERKKLYIPDQWYTWIGDEMLTLRKRF